MGEEEGGKEPCLYAADINYPQGEFDYVTSLIPACQSACECLLPCQLASSGSL